MAVLLAAVVMFASGCWVQPADLKPFMPPVTELTTVKVVSFMDSLGAMAEVPVKEMAKARPFESWSYNAQGGTRVQHWLPAMANVTPDEVVMFELLTNNAANEAINTGELPANMAAGFEAVRGARCIVVPTLNTTGAALIGGPYETRVHWVNDKLRSMVASGEWPNLVLYDWDARSMGRVDWLVGGPNHDYLHYGGTVTADGTVGNIEYADAINDAVQLCA